MLSEQVIGLEKENKALKYENELLKRKLEDNPERKPYACKHCKFFIQHYGKNRYGYFLVNAGHCAVGRGTKQRPAEHETCSYFEFGDYDLTVLQREARTND